MACTALALLAGPAAANCAGGPFAGPYIGGTVGYGHFRSEQSSPGDPSISGSDDAFVAGLHGAYNLQCGRVVVGVEADINYADFSADSAWPDPVYLTSSLDWFGTVRGKLGVTVHDHALIYVTGGLAYADVSHHLFVPTPPLGPAFSQTNSEFAAGWTVGGGIEFLRSERWLLRAEALYVDLGSETHTYTITGCGGTCTDTAKWDDSFWVARLGLTLKLGERERYVPLK